MGFPSLEETGGMGGIEGAAWGVGGTLGTSYSLKYGRRSWRARKVCDLNNVCGNNLSIIAINVAFATARDAISTRFY